ncbi:MAG: hypothetical protein KC503_03520, partial [Myxococcales bacterium]|nr:hypothetical protein [Myxococcales bacterium]
MALMLAACTRSGFPFADDAATIVGADGELDARDGSPDGVSPPSPLEPSNQVELSWLDSPQLGEVRVDADVVFDLDDDTLAATLGVRRFLVEQGANLPDLVVFAARSVRVSASATLRVTGSAAIAVLAEEIVIDGTINLSGGAGTGLHSGGPGGFDGGRARGEAGRGPGGGGAGARGAATGDGGGGGGGHAAAGGVGGQPALAGKAGAIYGMP